MQIATHKGTCQLCRVTQNLPGGRLSNHGYTVEWGFFSGICRGSGALPFELSADLIRGAIDNAKAQIEEARDELGHLKTQSERLHYRAWAYRYGRYGWVIIPADELNVIDEGEGYSSVWIVIEGEKLPDQLFFRGSLSDAIITHNNEPHGWAGALRHRIAGLENHIEWQEKRLASWAPGELKAI